MADYRYEQTYPKLQDIADVGEQIAVVKINTTSYAEVVAAVTANQYVFCRDDSSTVYQYVGQGSGYYWFGRPSVNGGLDYWRVNSSSEWSHVSATALAPLESPALTGTPTAPTANKGDNSTKIATTAYADRAADAAADEAEANANSYTDNALEEAVGDMSEIIARTMPTETVSGEIVSFEDGSDGFPVESLTVSIDPLQNLNGYDHPWPAGGGKNKYPLTVANLKASNTSGTWSGNAYTIAGITLTVLTDSDNNVTGIRANGTATANVNFGVELPALPAGNYLLTGGINSVMFVRIGVDGTNYTSTGDEVSFTCTSESSITASFIRVQNATTVNNLTFYPMLRLSTETDSTFAPYSNICPIEGWTGAKITRTGKNLFDGEYLVGYLESGYIWRTNNASTRTAIVPIKGGETYTVKKYGGVRFAVCEATDGLPVAGTAYTNLFNDNTASQATVTPSASANYLYIYVTNDNTEPQMQVEVGSSASPYEPYLGTTYSVSWADEAGTVYKGTAEYKGGGEWEITAPYKGIDLSTLAWSWQSTWQAWYVTSLTDFKRPASGSVAFDGIAEQYVAAPMTDITQTSKVGVMGKADATDTFAIRNGSDSTTPTGLLVYPIITPVVFTVTGPDPETLLGDNNIWANCGEIEELTYRANTALYIEKKLAEG